MAQLEAWLVTGVLHVNFLIYLRNDIRVTDSDVGIHSDIECDKIEGRERE